MLRTTGGRFLHVAPDGRLRPERRLPGPEGVFEIVTVEKDAVHLKGHTGRWLSAEGRDADVLRADSPRTEPGERETLVVVPAGENRIALKTRGYREFIALDGGHGQPRPANPADQPAAEETIEVFRVQEMSPGVRDALAGVIGGLLVKELTGKQYDKVRTRKIEKFAKLPAPTRHDLLRTKTRRVLSITEEQQVQARLDGTPELAITQMPYLIGYRKPGVRMMMFAVRATVPVAGRVRCRVPDAVSGSCGFRTSINLNFSGEVRIEKSGDTLSLGSPDLLDLAVSLESLDLSNDILNLGREPIRDCINHELRENQERIRQKAAQAVHKAVEAREFRHPLIGFLGSQE